MRPLRWLGKISLTLVITVIFVTVSLIPKPTRSAFAQDPAAPPLPMPEDPLGQQPEQELPEISINVDARDGHLNNGRNRVTQAVQAAGSLNLTTTLTWDGNDNLLSVTNPRGIRTDYTYNATHNLTSVRKAVGTADEALTQYTYTTWGGVASVDPRNFTTTYAYTVRRQIQTITPAGRGHDQLHLQHGGRPGHPDRRQRPRLDGGL